jgi:hypothetical protein
MRFRTGLFLLCCGALGARGLQPLHPLRLAQLGDWPNATAQHLHYGDVRAVVQLTDDGAATSSTAPVSVRIFWRRRDAQPEAKGVLVTDDAGNRVALAAAPQIASACGVVSFVPLAGARTYRVYYLPFMQQGSGARLHFSWFNCTSHTRECALFAGGAGTSAQPADLCSSSSSSSSSSGGATVVALEGRAASASFDRPDFYMLDRMELTATDEELGALLGAPPAASAGTLRVFAEARERAVRMFDRVPADWARGGEKAAIALNASVGEYFTFQLGVFAPTANLTHFRVDFGGLLGSSSSSSSSSSRRRRRTGGSVPATAFVCFNLGGTDERGARMDRTAEYSVAAGAVGSLWIGVDLPADAGAAGQFAGRLTLSADDGTGSRVSVSVALNLDVVLPPSGQPMPDRGDGDIYSMSRLRWINSARAVDDTVPLPFTAPALLGGAAAGGGGGGGGFAVDLVNKRVAIGADGMLAQIAVRPNTAAFGARGGDGGDFELLARPLQVLLFDRSGAAVPLAVSVPAALVGRNATGVYWGAVLGGEGVTVRVTGSVEYDSFLSFGIEVGLAPGATALELSDVQVSMAVGAEHARFLCGFGTEGVTAQHAALPLAWRWEMGTGNQALWLGRPEAGLMLKLRGEGPRWEDPLYGSDSFFIPFIPSSWGGAACGERCQKSAYGANVTAAADGSAYVATVFSGPRSLSTAAQQTEQLFQFDVAATPAKPLNLSAHFEQRYLQVGYGELSQYLSPQDAAAWNASVVTLHQGIPGVINGTLVNPYINYPFIPPTVELMENYTAQARALGMRTKVYYTIRELSNRAAELFALKAIGGMLVAGDPWNVAQPGYCHEWDCHGGAAWLHQHVATNYGSCWQQALSSNEIDAAVCDTGLSRFFNFYIEGLFWSASHAPHVDGLYFDGINFDRKAMMRVRKALDAGAGARGRPLIDMHGSDHGAGSPSALRWLEHFAFADSAWNAEGVKYATRGPAYYLVAGAGLQHGFVADRLDNADEAGEHDFRSLLFGMTKRNAPNTPAMWAFWAAAGVGEDDMAMHGWWAPESSPAALRLSPTPAPAPPSPAPVPTPCGAASFAFTAGSYVDSAHGPAGNIGFGGNTCGGSSSPLPAMNASEAEALCCSLAAAANSSCAGFSINKAKDAQGKSAGCLKKDTGGGRKSSAQHDGYALAAGAPTPAPGPTAKCSASASTALDPDGATSAVLATVHAALGRVAVVVVASWCTAHAAPILVLNWTALGLDEASAVVEIPAIAGWQAAAPTFAAAALATNPLDVAPQHGVLLVVRPAPES